MEACLGLGRSQRNLNKQQQKELKLQDQHQQQQQHTQLQQQKQQTQAIITNQNYYTTQQQPQNQRHLAARGQTTNVGAQKPGVQQQQQQQQHNDESHLVKQQQQQQQQQQNVQHNTTPTPCTTTHKYRNTAAAATTTANMQQPSLLTLNDNTSGGGNAVQQQPQPQAISFQKNTVTVEVTPTLPSSVSPTNTPAIVTNANVKTFRKINRQAQQQQLQQQQQQQQQHQHQHLLHQQQQQQLEADLDAIEVCVDPEPHVSFKGGVGGLLRQTKTLGRLNHQHQHQHHHSIEDQHGQWANMSQTTSLQLLQLQQQQQHDYSYAYYEPGAAMRHTNIPHADLMAGANEDEDLTPPPPNSIRALLSKGKKNKLLVSPATRQSYQTRLTQQQSHNVAGATTAPANCSNISTPENFYEEISASSTSSSSNSMTSHHQLRATSHSAGSLNQTLVEEELRRVQNRHHKILGELNLSVEAMLMPESPPNSSPTAKEPQSTPSVSVTTASGQPLRLTSSSADNICDTALAGGPADDFISPIPNSATVSAGLLQSSCLAADLDSGFSGSSGASYIGSLRLHKTNALMCSRSNNPSSTTTAAAGGNAAAKSQQSAFAYDTQSCRSFQRANSNNATATATATSASVSASSSSAASATTSSCTIKHLPQIHHNTKHQQQQQLHMQHQHHQHHHSHLHQHHHHHHLHQQQQHQQSQHINDDLQNSSGFFTRASCGRRILNCAKIRAAEDPGPVVLNAQPNESKARSFWNRKGWRKLPGFSTSTSSINDTGLSTDESKLNSGSWEDPLPSVTSATTTATPHHNNNQQNLSIASAQSAKNGNITTTTAQLHNLANLRRPDTLAAARHNLQPLIIQAPINLQQQQQQQQLHTHSSSQQHSAYSGNNLSGRCNEAALQQQQQPLQGAVVTGNTIAGGSFNANGGSTAVGTNSQDGTSSPNTTASENLTEHNTKGVDFITKSPLPPNSSSEDEELANEEELNSSVTSSLSATNQRNSQLRSTFNRAKQHLSFDKWRSSNANNSTADTSSNSSTSSGSNSGTLTRRASTTCANMPTAHQPPREDITTPGESPGGRLSRWFSIRRGSSHQYDVGGRDGRQSSSSSIDLPDAVVCDSTQVSPQKLTTNLANSSKSACKMPGVPENEDDDISSLTASTSRFDLDLMIPPGSRANGTARSAHNRLVQPMLPPAPPGLSQQQLKRRHIVAAIVHSENSYVATLQRLVNDYKKPLEDSSPPVLSATKISTLFHRLPEILQSHQLFRIALAECVRNWDRDEKLGDCFVSAFSKPRILEIYSGFINNFSAAMELAKMEEKRKSALADFFKVKQISAHDRLSFFGLMVKPVQRFPQFILFLQDLLKYTPQGHHDRMSLQLALTQLELLAEMLNERKREAEQYQGFKEMLGHISGTFNTRSLTTTEGNRPRYLLREDNVTHMEFNQAGFIVKSKQRRLLLLNDKVICVSVAPKQSHDFGATEKLTFKWMYPVTDVEIVDNSTSATLSRILTAGLNRGGSLKSNSSSCNNYSTTNTLPANTSSPLAGLYQNAAFDNSPAALLTNGADNLCNEMSTLMYDYEVVSRINDLVGSLKGTYKELNTNVTRNLMNSIQSSIQRKNEEMAWVDSCCLQLVAKTKNGKEETFTFQTANPNVKKEWITELRLAQLALDVNNSPAWETTSAEPCSTTTSTPAYEQQQMQLIQRQSNKMPLFVKAMPVYKSQHQTEVRCGCYYTIANDSKISGNARRRHKQQNYLWICTTNSSSSHLTVYSQHHQQAGNLRDVGSFELADTQVTAIEFVKGLDNCKTREEYNSLLGDLIWMGTDSKKILIYSAKNPEQEEQLNCCSVPACVTRILYHFDTIYVALSNACILIYRRAYDGVWLLKDPQMVQLGESGLPVPSILPINMNIYAACANRVYVLNALNGEIQRSFEVHHGSNQQVNLMAHSGIGLWISLKNSTMLCLYHTETFKHLQDINIASSVLRSDGKKEQAVNNSAIYVTALMACKGLLWVGTNVGIAVTIPLPRLEGVPIISGGISMSCHAHFGPITFLLPLVPKVCTSYKALTSGNAQTLATALNIAAAEPVVPSMGDDLQLPAIDADPKKLSEADLDESNVVLRRDLPKDDTGSGSASPSAFMLREFSAEGADSATSSPRCSKLDKQNSLDQSFSAKIRASLANSPAFHRKRFRDLSSESARTCKTLPRGLGSAGYFPTGLNSNTSTLSHGEHGYCDVYGLYGKLIYVKEDYDAEEGTQGNLMDMMYEGMRRSDPELAAIPGRVTTLDRRLKMKASRPRSLDLSNWSVDSKSSSLYTSSGSEESMGIRFFGGRSVSRNSSSASHKTSGNGSDLGNISENGLMTDLHHNHSTPKSEDGFKLMQQHKQNAAAAGNANISATPPPAAATATLKRKQKQNAKQQQQLQADGPRTIITLTGGRGYWRHVWYNNTNSPGHKSSSSSSSLSSGASSPLIANSNDAHIVIWEKKL